MDKPTTHLDIHTVESLILALESYEGTLVFISHDVHTKGDGSDQEALWKFPVKHLKPDTVPSAK